MRRGGVIVVVVVVVVKFGCEWRLNWLRGGAVTLLKGPATVAPLLEPDSDKQPIYRWIYTCIAIFRISLAH